MGSVAIRRTAGIAKPCANLPEAAPHHEHEDIAYARAQRHAHPYLLRTAGTGLRNHCVNTDRSHYQANESEAAEGLAKDAEEPCLVFYAA